MKKIAFCGGGSAGHVIPNIAVAEQLKDKYSICYIGTDGIEKGVCADYGIDFLQFKGVKLIRGKLLPNLLIPFKLFSSVIQCKAILEKERPDLLFCKGGYVSLPPALASARLKIPVITHESDLSAGLANKIIAKMSERILTSFPETATKFKNGVHTGSPMRQSLFGRNQLEAKRSLGLDLRPTVLVFGGGGGSRIINKTLRQTILPLCKKYNVVHVCGRGNKISSNVYGYLQTEFCEDMGQLYAAADYAVARCGSNSAFELIALKKPTLFIPLDNGATRGDQTENAAYFKERGLCRVLDEAELSPRSLYEEIEKLIGDGQLKTALRRDDTECGNKNVITEIERALKS